MGIDEVHMAIESAIEAEVAEVGGRAFEILRVVAENGECNAILFAFGSCCSGDWCGCGESFCDVVDKLIVTAYMRPYEPGADVDLRGLAGAFKVQQRAAVL